MNLIQLNGKLLNVFSISSHYAWSSIVHTLWTMWSIKQASPLWLLPNFKMLDI